VSTLTLAYLCIVIRHIGESLVQAMEMALKSCGRRDRGLRVRRRLGRDERHLNWELIHEVAEKSKGEQREALKAAMSRSRSRRTSGDRRGASEDGPEAIAVTQRGEASAGGAMERPVMIPPVVARPCQLHVPQSAQLLHGV
jgi:hypothetical protein